jgi:hypothetical protein
MIRVLNLVQHEDKARGDSHGELAVACRHLLAEQELDSRIGRIDEGIRLGDFQFLRDRWI